MDALLQQIVDNCTAVDQELSTAEAAAAQVQPLIDANNQLQASLVTINGQLKDTKTQLVTAETDLAAAMKALLRKRMIYAGLEKFALFTADKKIPFQWIQPSNTGNTGGGSALPHGTETWALGPNGVVITSFPKNIAPQSDNFDNYMVLPFPETPPRRMGTIAKNYSCATPADWLKCQQLEGPVIEYIGEGFQSTCAWRFNPKTGLGYWNGSRWVTLLVNGAPVIVNMGQPTMLIAEHSLDHAAHTFTYEWIVINGTLYNTGITCNAVPFNSSSKQLSIAVQLDCQAAAPSYAAILDGLAVELQ